MKETLAIAAWTLAALAVFNLLLYPFGKSAGVWN